MLTQSSMAAKTPSRTTEPNTGAKNSELDDSELDDSESNVSIDYAKKKHFTQTEEDALNKLHKCLQKIQPGDLDRIKQTLTDLFWPKQLAGAIPLLDAISKLNPKFQEKIVINRPNQAYRQPRLRWTQYDLIYCLAFEIPDAKNYYLAKVGMTATKGEYDPDENKTYSRFENLHERYENQLSKSELGPLSLTKKRPTFKLMVSPYDTNNVTAIEGFIRKTLGWPVEASVMKKYRMSEPTEWIIIPPTQSKLLRERFHELMNSSEVLMLDTRLLNQLPKLPDKEKRIEFKWINTETKKNVIFQPFEQNIQKEQLPPGDADIDNEASSQNLPVSPPPTPGKSERGASRNTAKGDVRSNKTTKSSQEKTKNSKK